jgi:uncharacterized protein YheU (UPF0270 family)
MSWLRQDGQQVDKTMQRALRLPNREGTDYGLHEVPLATKIGQVRHQLDAGTAVIIYDEATDSWTIQPTDQRSEPP